jgi:hypothetical protein
MSVSPRARIWIVALLVACAAALFTLTRLTGRAGSVQVQRVPPRSVQGEARTISQHVEAVAAAFSIPRGAMRVLPTTKSHSGVPEVRLQVDPEFSSYEFQCALAGALADCDATVVGTEHLRERDISLQIVHDGSPVMLVVLNMRRSPQQQRKESSHQH